MPSGSETADLDEGSDETTEQDTDGLGSPVHEVLLSLPTVRQEHGAAALNGEIYVLGGFTPDVSRSVQVYSPQTDSWRDAADFPEPFHHPNVAVVDGLLYVLGFHYGPGLRTADPRTYAYDPVEDAWMPRLSLPTGTERGSSCVAVVDATIFLFGGASDMTLATAHAYDTTTDTWDPIPALPEPREHCLAAGIDGNAYIVSGRANGIAGLELESWVYDPIAQTYQERAPILTPRGGAAGGVLGGRIYVFGGEGNRADVDGIFHEVEAYDPVSDSWEALPDMLIPRHGYAAAVVDDRIYLPGGATFEGFGATDHHTVFSFGEDP